MKKITLILIISILTLTTVGCGCSKKEQKQEKLQIDLKDNIQAIAKITKNVDLNIVRVNFERRDEGEKVELKLSYYKDKKEIYKDQIIYQFPAKDIDCVLDIPIQSEIIKITDPSQLNSKKVDKNATKEKLEYDYLKLTIQK